MHAIPHIYEVTDVSVAHAVTRGRQRGFTRKRRNTRNGRGACEHERKWRRAHMKAKWTIHHGHGLGAPSHYGPELKKLQQKWPSNH